MIKLLNRLGHGVSYSELEEIERALCLKKIESEEEMAVILPSNIYPGVPTTLSFDNIDRLEETLSGSGTSHLVNGIVIQPMVHTLEAPTPAGTMPKQRKRSIAQTQFVLPSFNAGECVDPPAIRPMSLDCNEALIKHISRTEVLPRRYTKLVHLLCTEFMSGETFYRSSINLETN